jgi:hypothetical protein
MQGAFFDSAIDLGDSGSNGIGDNRSITGRDSCMNSFDVGTNGALDHKVAATTGLSLLGSFDCGFDDWH